MKLKYSRILSVLLISFSLIFNACGIATVTGFGLGVVVDEIRPDSKIVDREYYKTIELDEIITIHLYNNSSKEGKFRGIDVVTATTGDIQDYTEKYLILGIWPDFQRINLDEIRSVEIKSHHKDNGKWYGFGIGLALDVALYIAFTTWYGYGT